MKVIILKEQKKKTNVKYFGMFLDRGMCNCENN